MLQSTICTYPAPLSMQLQPLNLAAVCLQTCVWSVASAVAGDVFSVSAPLASGLPERGNCSLLAKIWEHKPPSFCAPANYAQDMRPTPAQPGKAMPRVVTMWHLFHTPSILLLMISPTHTPTNLDTCVASGTAPVICKLRHDLATLAANMHDARCACKSDH